MPVKTEKRVYRGAENAGWKGDEVGMVGLHAWIRRQKPEPECCEQCKEPKERALDLANISQEYHRHVDDWEYLCRRCHMTKDGCMNNLNKGRFEQTFCACGKPTVTHNGVCMKKYNCLRRHKTNCDSCQ